MKSLENQFSSRNGKQKAGGQHRDFVFHISPLALLPPVCFLLLGAGKILLPAFCAAAFHEFGHVAAIYLVGSRVTGVRIEPFGGEIETDDRLYSYGAELFVSLAGVLVNFLFSLFLLLEGTPIFVQEFALCSLGMGIFNVMPLKGLDGGSALKAILLKKCSLDRADFLCQIAAISCMTLFCATVIAGCFFFFWNPTLLLILIYLFFTVW